MTKRLTIATALVGSISFLTSTQTSSGMTAPSAQSVDPSVGRRRNSLQCLPSDQSQFAKSRSELRRTKFCRHRPDAFDERTSHQSFSPYPTPNHAQLHSESRRNRLSHCVYSKSRSELGHAVAAFDNYGPLTWGNISIASSRIGIDTLTNKWGGVWALSRQLRARERLLLDHEPPQKHARHDQRRLPRHRYINRADQKDRLCTACRGDWLIGGIPFHSPVNSSVNTSDGADSRSAMPPSP